MAMKVSLACVVCMGLALVSLSLLAADAPLTRPRPATAPAARGRAATAPASRPEDDESSADAVIRALLDSRDGETVILPKSPASQPASQPAGAARPIVDTPSMQPGAMIYQRLGRLVREGGGEWWAFHFESEKNVLYEPPMRVLPNRLLEAMETTLQSGASTSVRFLISGEVTEYKGQQYLLIRKQLVKRDLGAF